VDSCPHDNGQEVFFLWRGFCPGFQSSALRRCVVAACARAHARTYALQGARLV
jgi:hypothetical protein